MISKEKKREVISKSQRHTLDTGSPEVQISILTNRIWEMMEHLKVNKKDFSSRRGLQKLVAKRKKLMSYLNAENSHSYNELIESLGIRG